MIEGIRSAGQAAGRVADGLRGVDCAAAVPAGDAGMPGARCVGKLTSLKQAWQGREPRFVGDLDGYAAGMSQAAQTYSSREDAAARDLTVAGQGRRPS
ncbi:hypothetical protein [Amycolatopsis suaedae]|uniref:hypothetical protein n=1 Tax=Amycolatopsis suaedae TaxID=2510978 RepID=UPI001F118615|nr:hypothetical protein [Amycolatopsis suaedae]